MKKNLSVVTGLKGVYFLATIINNNSDIFQKNDAENDIGFDGYIEFRSENKSANYTIACQIKTGESYFREGKIYVQSDHKHFEYWSDHNLYSFMFVYNDRTNKCYWLDLSNYTKSYKQNGKFIIKCSDLNELSEKTYSDFKNYALSTKESDINKIKLLKVAEEILDVNTDSLSNDIIKSLVNHRNSKLVWSIVLQKFLMTNDRILLFDLIIFMGWTTSNPDIFWNKNNIIGNDYKLQLYKLIFSVGKDQFIEKMVHLSTSEDVEFSRGGLGQTMFHILEKIDGYEESLIKIIESKVFKSEVRINALFFLFLYKDNNFINKYYSLLLKLKEDGELSLEEFKMYSDHLISYGGFTF